MLPPHSSPECPPDPRKQSVTHCTRHSCISDLDGPFSALCVSVPSLPPRSLRCPHVVGKCRLCSCLSRLLSAGQVLTFSTVPATRGHLSRWLHTGDPQVGQASGSLPFAVLCHMDITSLSHPCAHPPGGTGSSESPQAHGAQMVSGRFSAMNAEIRSQHSR